MLLGFYSPHGKCSADKIPALENGNEQPNIEDEEDVNKLIATRGQHAHANCTHAGVTYTHKQALSSLHTGVH